MYNLLFYLVFVSGTLIDEILSSHSNCSENHKHFRGDTLAYITPWNDLGYSYALKYPSKFTYISPVWHELSLYNSLGETGFSITGEENSDFLSKAQGLFKIVPRVIITKTHPRNYIKLLGTDELIQEVGNNLASFASRNNYQGFVLEFWLQGLSIIREFKNFEELRSLQLRMLTRLARVLHSHKLQCIITLPPMRAGEITPQEFLVLIENFDKVNVMTYDFSPENPGPNAPLHWISETFARLLQGNDVDFGKLLLGIPFYGYDYGNGSGHGKAIVGKEFIGILKGNARDVWDEEEKEHKFIYSQKGKECVVYYPTLDMITERLKFAEKNGMGVAIWELGQGLEHFFNIF